MTPWSSVEPVICFELTMIDLNCFLFLLISQRLRDRLMNCLLLSLIQILWTQNSSNWANWNPMNSDFFMRMLNARKCFLVAIKEILKTQLPMVKQKWLFRDPTLHILLFVFLFFRYWQKIMWGFWGKIQCSIVRNFTYIASVKNARKLSMYEKCIYVLFPSLGMESTWNEAIPFLIVMNPLS